MLRINVWEARAAGSFSFSRLFTQGPNPLATTALGGHGFASFLLGTGNSGPALPELEERRLAELLSRLVCAGRLAPQRSADAQRRPPLRLRRAAHRALRPHVVVRSGGPARRWPGRPRIPGPARRAEIRRRRRTRPVAVRRRLEQPRAAAGRRVSADGEDGRSAARSGASSARARSPRKEPSAHTGSASRRHGSQRSTTSRRVNLLRNPFPEGFRPVPGASDGLLTALGGRVEAPLRDTNTPNVWQWNVTVQHELPGSILVEAAYVGNRGRDLSLGGEGGYTLNQLDPSYLSLGSALNQLVPNPFYGHVTTGPLAQPTVARGQLLRPVSAVRRHHSALLSRRTIELRRVSADGEPPLRRRRSASRRAIVGIEEHGLGSELSECLRPLER